MWEQLLVAIKKNNTVEAKKLINLMSKKDFDKDYSQLNWFQIPLHLAVDRGNETITNNLLSLKFEFASVVDKGGYTALHIAAEKGNDAMVTKFLSISPGSVLVANNNNKKAFELTKNCAIKNKIVEIYKIEKAKDEEKGKIIANSKVKLSDDIVSIIENSCTSKLKVINLAGNNIDDTQAIAIADLVSEKTYFVVDFGLELSITSINFCNNSITDTGAKVLAEKFHLCFNSDIPKYNSIFKQVFLDRNKSITEEFKNNYSNPTKNNNSDLSIKSFIEDQKDELSTNTIKKDANKRSYDSCYVVQNDQEYQNINSCEQLVKRVRLEKKQDLNLTDIFMNANEDNVFIVGQSNNADIANSNTDCYYQTHFWDIK